MTDSFGHVIMTSSPPEEKYTINSKNPQKMCLSWKSKDRSKSQEHVIMMLPTPGECDLRTPLQEVLLLSE